MLFSEDLDYNEPCPIPCDRTLFEPSLSYASLSRYNTKSILFQGMSDVSRKIDEMTDNFHLATETKQRVTRDIYTYDQDQISLASDLLDDVIALVNETMHTMESASYLANTRGVKDVFVDGQHVMIEEYSEWRQLLVHRHRDLIYMIRSPFSGLHYMQWGYEDFGQFLNTFDYFWQDSELNPYLEAYTLIEAIQQCLNNNISMDVVVGNPDIEYYEVLQYNSSVITNETFCIYYLQYKIGTFKRNSEYVLQNLQNLDEHFDKSLLLYESGLNDLLNDTGVYPQDFAEYWECLAEINNTEGSFLLFKDLYEDATLIGDQSTVEDLLAYAEYLTEEYENDLVVQAYEASKSAYQNDHVCNFPRRYSGEITQGSDEYLMKEAALSLMETAIKHHDNAVKKYALILEEMDEILLTQDQQIVPTVGILKSYLAGHITKRELAKNFTGLEAVDLYSILNYDDMISQFSKTANQLRSTVENAISYYKDAYKTLWDLKIPVYNYTLLWESPLWSELLEPSPNTSLQAIISNITEQRPWPINFHDMFDILFEPFLSYPSEQDTAIDNTNQKFFDVMMSYYDHLETFQGELVIDNAFYL